MRPLTQTLELQPDPSELRLLRAFVSRWAERLGLSEEERFCACLVATEAVTNAIRHGHGSVSGSAAAPVVVSCRSEGDDLVLEVRDRGRFRSERDRADDHGGRGLFLIRELTRDFELEAGDGGTRLCMRLGAASQRLALAGSAA